MTQRVRHRTALVLTLIAMLRAALSPGAADDCAVPAERRGGTRTMQHDDPIIQQALTVLGQALNAIAVVTPEEIREIYARAPAARTPPTGLNAFRAPGDTRDPVIYVNRDSQVYRSAARKPSPLAVLTLASVLAHEQVHNTDGEFAAYRLQSDLVRSRLTSIPWHQQQQALRYLEALDARAHALGRVTGFRDPRRGLTPRVGSPRPPEPRRDAHNPFTVRMCQPTR